MAADTTFVDVAERHAEAIRNYFGKPVDVLGASTGGSLTLQLIADRPDVVRCAVVACADRRENIQTETLVICGAQDDFWTPEMFAEIACRLPQGKLIMYPKRGHALIAAPEFFRDVTAFFGG
jgi:pimeloyl-ACP methyl ester carboxylesterase